MPQSLEKDTVALIVIEVKRHLTHHGIKVDKFRGLRLEVVTEAVLESLLKLIGTISWAHELHLGVHPLYDDMHTFTIKFLSASKFKIGETFLETLTYMYILQLFLNQIAGILD